MTEMYKRLAVVLCALLGAVSSLAQTGTQPMGIPRLGISGLELQQPASVPNLGIASNQTLMPPSDCACLNCVVLPVELLTFEGRRLDADRVMLNWKTMNEFHNKGFEVQRSLGNERDFVPVAFVPAQTSGAAAYAYELPDNNSYSGISYYRLRQVDIDDRYTFSETIAIKGYGIQAALALYPNPVTDKLLADVFVLQKTRATLLVSDATQKKLLLQNIVLNKGWNQLSIPTTQFAGGVYLLQVVPELGTAQAAKFIKL